MRKVFLTVLLLLVSLAPVRAQQQEQLDTATLGNVLYCLQSKVASIGYAPPRFSEHSFKLRYLLTTQ